MRRVFADSSNMPPASGCLTGNTPAETQRFGSLGLWQRCPPTADPGSCFSQEARLFASSVKASND